MVTKKRLEELIEQGAVIYDVFKGDIFLVDLTMAKYYEMTAYIEYLNDYYNCNLTRNTDDLFETKEDAEWKLRYSNIVRTERLILPRWEELQEILRGNGRVDIYFYDANKMQHALWATTTQICLVDFYVDGSYGRIGKEFSKENYTTACEWAKKLFLGENL